MTRPIGRLPGIALVLTLLLGAALPRAEVAATVDRNQVAIGDTFRLVISATEDDEDISGVDLSALERDFEVLQRSTKSNTRIVNGQRTHNRQLVMEITPRREGTLRIPPFSVGNSTTRPITVAVSESPRADPGTETVLFEAELDREQVYVQGQLILTLRLQQAINLDRRSISELEMDNAFVMPLEQQSFQRTINGRPWLVHEVRYAIFPEQSGTLSIPAQSFSARESKPRDNWFSSANQGRLVRRNTAALLVEVLPRPGSYPAGATWLPARALTLEEKWSSDPATLRAGESVTRTIEVRGAGLQGAQLPPATPDQTEGLKYFPDQPSINDSEISTGLLGARTDSTAIVPTREGQVTLPEVRIPWWDTEAEELRFAVLPAHTLNIAPAQTIGLSKDPSNVASPVPGTVAFTSPAPASSQLWQVVALVCALGWLGTLVLLFRGKRRPLIPDPPEKESTSLKGAYKQLLAACASDNASRARAALVEWSIAISGNRSLGALSEVGTLFGDEALEREIERLECSLYSNTPASWSGTTLATEVKRLHKQAREEKDRGGDELTLYPTGA